MIQYKKKIVRQEVEKVKSITVICNKCLVQEKVDVIDDNLENAVAESTIKRFSNVFDLESDHSGETWSFHLCEKCLIKFIKSLKLLPEGFQENPFSKNTSCLQERQDNFIKWREE